ncbi:hypothetical protein HMSSN036_40610 [Paenibacillus macerans]|nr:hypothetical protein HMSSN036_40610 [Paenibacillus macerans]
MAVALGMQDRRARMRELVYSRRTSSMAIVFVRYAAMVAVMFLPVLALAGYATVLTAGDYAGYAIDRLAFIKYSLGWLLPTLMVAAAVGVLLTELTDSPVAIAVQALWWIIALNSGLTHMEGGYGADLMIRHNTIGNTEVSWRISASWWSTGSVIRCWRLRWSRQQAESTSSKERGSCMEKLRSGKPIRTSQGPI